MTTAQTGGGNGAAPDGGSERIVPDAPGLWLIGADPESTPGELWYEAVTVYQGRSGLLVSGRMPNRVDQNPCITWLAPIPGPAVLAALAEYGEAEDAILAAPRRPAPAPRRELFNATMVAHEKLMDAIRAERGGGA